MTLEEILRVASRSGGFLSKNDIDDIASKDRLRQLLVRCGACRFLAAAQDINHLIKAVNAIGDYVRDVSLPTSDPAYRGDFLPVTPRPTPNNVPSAARAAMLVASGLSPRYQDSRHLPEPSDADPGL